MPALGTLTVSVYRNEPNAVEYTLPAHSVTAKNVVALRRTDPAVKGTDPGALSTNIRFARNVTVNGFVREATANVSVRLPVGSDAAFADGFIADIRAAVAGAQFASLVKSGDIHIE